MTTTITPTTIKNDTRNNNDDNDNNHNNNNNNNNDNDNNNNNNNSNNNNNNNNNNDNLTANRIPNNTGGSEFFEKHTPCSMLMNLLSLYPTMCTGVN